MNQLNLSAAFVALALATFVAPTVSAHGGGEQLMTGPDAPAAHAVTATYVGTITEVTVIDRVLGTTVRYVGLALADGTRVRLRGVSLPTAAARSTLEVTGRLEGTTLFLDRWRQLGSAPTMPAAAPGTTAQVEGRFTLIHFDDMQSGKSGYAFSVVDVAGQATELTFPVFPDILANGMQVSVSGTLDPASRTLNVDQITINALASDRSSISRDGIAAVSTNQVLVILVKFTDTVAEPFTQAAVQSLMFGAAPTASVAEFYKEASYGRQLLAGTVTPWLVGSMTTPTTCNFSGIGTAGDNAATAAGYNIDNYVNRVYIFPRVSSCGWAGLAYIGWGRAYINQSLSLQVIGHELGHNFGAYHAASLRCGTNVIGGTCTSSEYGDVWGIMGNSRAAHFNSLQKLDFGWITPGSVVTHAPGTASYALSPLALSGGGTYAVKVPVGAYRTYWLEYRQANGFDSAIGTAYAGVQFRVASPFESICNGCADDTELLDMTPTTSSFNDAALMVGSTYRDNARGLVVTVQSASPTVANVTVRYDPVSPSRPQRDLDGNRTYDLLWYNAMTGESAAWLMSGAMATSSAPLLADVNWQVTQLADLDADGKSDLLWRHANGTTFAWLMNGATPAAGGTLFSDPNWSVIRTGDFDADGRTDLVWRNSSDGQTAIWLMNGLVPRTSSLVMTASGWQVTHVGDFNGDGRSDLVWRNSGTGQTAIWLMNGVAMTTGSIILGDANWQVVAVGDFDGDGRSDLVWRNASTGQTAVWLMNGAATASSKIEMYDASWRVTHVGDFNGDGKDDLLWRNDALGQTAMWLMNGTNTISAAILLTNAAWGVSHVGDLDGDRKSDLVWRNAATGDVVVWTMNGTTFTATANYSWGSANYLVSPAAEF